MASQQQPKPKIFMGGDALGKPLHDGLVTYLKEKGFEVEDLGADNAYYSVAAEVGKKVAASKGTGKGLLCCGTGMGIGMIANKVPGIRAAIVENRDAAVNSRSVNNSNVLAMGALTTNVEEAQSIFEAWLDTPFKGAAPANHGHGWPQELHGFLDQSMKEISQIELTLRQQHTAGEEEMEPRTAPCPICCQDSQQKYTPVESIPGAKWIKVRQAPTRALVRFEKGAIEPAHHHTKGHDVFVTRGSKTVENLTLGQNFQLKAGDYLYTAAGQVHRVIYHEETDFVICSDGAFDVFWDEPFPQQ